MSGVEVLNMRHNPLAPTQWQYIASLENIVELFVTGVTTRVHDLYAYTYTYMYTYICICICICTFTEAFDVYHNQTM